MIDVIIPAYNAHDTIFQTLASVAIQTIRDKCKVYIVDDCSEKNYDDVIKSFSNVLNIEQLRTEKNSGAGYARQYGIDHSSSEYILFLDSDDLLHDCFSLKKLYDAISLGDYDLVAGAYINEGKNSYETFIASGNRVFGCLHGKIYKRKNLLDKNIRFNRTRYSEDNSFGGIVLNTTSKVSTIPDVVYVYRFNKNSLTTDYPKLVKIHTSYLHNMLWLSKQLEKRKVSYDVIKNVMLNSYVYIFHEVMTNPKVNFQKMFNECFMFEEYFKKMLDYITREDIYSYISIHFHGDELYIDSLTKGFMDFRTLFRKKGDE